MNEETKEDPPLTIKQGKLVEALDGGDLEIIDKALLGNVCESWRKVARVVGTTMNEFDGRFKGIPDVFFTMRIQELAKDGRIESQGNLKSMGRSEIRLAQR